MSNQITSIYFYESSKKLRQLNLLDGTVIQKTYPNALHATYSKKFSFYFILFDDWLIYVLDFELDTVAQFHFMTSYPLGLHFADDKLCLTIFTNKNVESLYLSDTNYIPINKQILFQSGFNKGFKVWKNLYFVWEQSTIRVFENNGALVCEKKTKIAAFITSLLYFELLEYIICGCSDGNIYTWCLYDNRTYINIFETAFKQPVEQLCFDRDPNKFWAYFGGFVKLYDIHTWQCVESYKLTDDYSSVIILNHRFLLATKPNTIYLLKKQITQQQVIQISSELKQVINSERIIHFVQDNNQIMQIDEGQIQNVYVSTKQTILKTFHHRGIYYFLTDKGDVIQIKDQSHDFFIQKKNFFDDSGYRVGQQILDICFHQDVALLSMDEGQILIGVLSEMPKIRTSINIHRTSISVIRTNGSTILTYDSHQQLRIGQLCADFQYTQLFMIQTEKMIHQIEYYRNYIMILQDGILDVFKDQKQVNDSFQDQQITTFNYNSSAKVIIAHFQDQIFILTFYKILVKHIYLDQICQGYAFQNAQLYLFKQEEVVKVSTEQFGLVEKESIRGLNESAKLLFSERSESISILEAKKVLPPHAPSTRRTIARQRTLIIPQSNIQILENFVSPEKLVPQKGKSPAFRVARWRVQSSHAQRVQSSDEHYRESLNVMTSMVSTSTKFYTLPDAAPLHTQPAIPRSGHRKRLTTQEKFIQDRIQKQKFRTRRDMTMNRIIQRNLITTQQNYC